MREGLTYEQIISQVRQLALDAPREILLSLGAECAAAGEVVRLRLSAPELPASGAGTEDLMTPEEVALAVKLKRARVLELCRQGAFGGETKIGKQIRIPRSAVERFIATRARS